MEMLVTFNPELPHPCSDKDEYACYDELYSLITSVMNGNLVEVGGADSLYDFSLHPTAKNILWMKVASISHRYSAQDSPLEDYSSDSTNINIFNELIRRVNARHRPYIGIRGTFRIGGHALLGLETSDNRLCVRDPNVIIQEEPFEDCQNYLYVKNDEVFYRQHGFEVDEKIRYLSLKTDEDQRVEDYIRIHYENCLSEINSYEEVN
jgi:hypothetical protein